MYREGGMASPLITVTFYEKDNAIFNWSTDTYPHFARGDRVFLKDTVAGDARYQPGDPLPLTQYKIKRVCHTFDRYYLGDDIGTICRVEVLVKAVDK